MKEDLQVLKIRKRCKEKMKRNKKGIEKGGGEVGRERGEGKKEKRKTVTDIGRCLKQLLHSLVEQQLKPVGGG